MPWTEVSHAEDHQERRRQTERAAEHLQRSPAKAQRTFAKTHDSAVEEYGEGRRAHQTAYGALKHSFEKVGDRWEPKDQKGPSDEQSAQGGARSSREYPSAEGVDANASKRHLQDVARRLAIGAVHR